MSGMKRAFPFFEEECEDTGCECMTCDALRRLEEDEIDEREFDEKCALGYI